MPPRNKLRQIERDKGVIDLWLRGSRIKLIMKVCGLTDSGIYKILDKHGISRSSKKHHKDSWFQLELFDP